MRKEIVMPLIAQGLGIETLPLVAGTRRRNLPALLMQALKAKDFSELEEFEGGVETTQHIKIQQLQKTVLFDMLFENKDAHFKQYMISEMGDLFKIDQEDYLSTSTLQGRGTKAGSFLAGLPQANTMLTPEVRSLVEHWDRERLANLLPAADIFSDEEIERVLENLDTIKGIMDANENISIRELFAQFNGLPGTPVLSPEMPQIQDPAVIFNYLGTRLNFTPGNEQGDLAIQKLREFSQLERVAKQKLEEERQYREDLKDLEEEQRKVLAPILKGTFSWREEAEEDEEEEMKQEHRVYGRELLKDWDPSTLL